MAKVPLLWASSARKEVMDALQSLWPSLDEDAQEALAAALVAGPPETLLSGDEEAQQSSRDRRIYDRITVIERVAPAGLGVTLTREMERLKEKYPDWRAPDGDKAHFGFWMEMRVGRHTDHTLDDLQQLTNDELTDLLIDTVGDREGLLDVWRDFAREEAPRALVLLEALLASQRQAPTDVWEFGLWGLREGVSDKSDGDRLLALLAKLPEAVFASDGFVGTIAEVLNALSRRQQRSSEFSSEDFWAIFDRALAAAVSDAGNLVEGRGEAAPQTDWVSFALNCSMGTLAGAFFNMLFDQRLEAGAGIPQDLAARLDKLTTTDIAQTRPARVVAASRLAYLFAIDPEWTKLRLIPSFMWTDEEESLAVWQGYAWQPRIEPVIWAQLKPGFLPLFTSERLERMRQWQKILAQLLMLVGVEFGAEELGRNEARDAIRQMPPKMRGKAAAWLASYVEREDPEEGDPASIAAPDKLWEDRVAPWIKRVWPREADMKSPAVSDAFARAAIATDEAFPQAVELISPFLSRGAPRVAIAALADSRHPDEHSDAALKLLDALVDSAAQHLSFDTLGDILDRLAVGTPPMATSGSYRKWREWLAVREA